MLEPRQDIDKPCAVLVNVQRERFQLGEGEKRKGIFRYFLLNSGLVGSWTVATGGGRAAVLKEATGLAGTVAAAVGGNVGRLAAT